MAILGKKLGMTQWIDKEGKMLPVTVVEAGPCIVTAVKTQEKHGYKAVQIGFGDKFKLKNTPKAKSEFFNKQKLPVKQYLREIKLTADENYEVGHQINVDVFKAGDLVDVRSRSVGKGFGGGVKRWHWAGGPGSHGSMFHRHIGSAGSNTYPGHSWRGLKMAGHLGDAMATVQNIEVLKIEPEHNVMVLKGSVPGSENGLLYVRRSLKRPQGVKPKMAPKVSEKKDPLKASKKSAAGKK
ncbi:MAG: 50S ribosomal protein L3 [Candidatus Omnitrophota bacterium]